MSQAIVTVLTVFKCKNSVKNIELLIILIKQCGCIDVNQSDMFPLLYLEVELDMVAATSYPVYRHNNAQPWNGK